MPEHSRTPQSPDAVNPDRRAGSRPLAALLAEQWRKELKGVVVGFLETEVAKQKPIKLAASGDNELSPGQPQAPAGTLGARAEEMNQKVRVDAGRRAQK